MNAAGGAAPRATPPCPTFTDTFATPGTLPYQRQIHRRPGGNGIPGTATDI
jgi:hypothetical protein